MNFHYTARRSRAAGCRPCGSMAAVKRLIIADAHVGQRTDDVADMVSMLLKARDSGVMEIIYLGDGFQYLIGMSKFWTAAVVEVIETWRILRRSGVRIGVVEGNRDFFLDAPELASEIDWSGLVYDFLSGSRRFRLVHGDKVNLRDLQYRFWSRISKSGFGEALGSSAAPSLGGLDRSLDGGSAGCHQPALSLLQTPRFASTGGRRRVVAGYRRVALGPLPHQLGIHPRSSRRRHPSRLARYRNRCPGR